jgi:hypothetical protein
VEPCRLGAKDDERLLRLKTYIFEHPTDNDVASITRRSYIFAGLFGAFYVLARGFVGRFFLALAVDALVILIGMVATVAIAAHMSTLDTSVALVFLVLILMMVRASPIVGIVKTGYQRRGWSVTLL